MAISPSAAETSTSVVSNWIFIAPNSSGRLGPYRATSSALRVRINPSPASGAALALAYKATPMQTMTMPHTASSHCCQ